MPNGRHGKLAAATIRLCAKRRQALQLSCMDN